MCCLMLLAQSSWRCVRTWVSVLALHEDSVRCPTVGVRLRPHLATHLLDAALLCWGVGFVVCRFEHNLPCSRRSSRRDETSDPKGKHSHISTLEDQDIKESDQTTTRQHQRQRGLQSKVTSHVDQRDQLERSHKNGQEIGCSTSQRQHGIQRGMFSTLGSAVFSCVWSFVMSVVFADHYPVISSGHSYHVDNSFGGTQLTEIMDSSFSQATSTA